MQVHKLLITQKPFILAILASMAFTISGCAHLNKEANETPLATEVQSIPEEKDKPEYGDFDGENDTLYDLLVAEIAAQRNQFNVTLLNYIQQARHTRDPGVIRRAINAAQFAKDSLAIKELALLWEEVEPENASVHQLLAYQYSIEKQYSDAIYHIDRAIELGGRISIESLAIGSQSLPEEEKRQLYALYQKLLDKHPDNVAINYSLAIIENNLKELDQALERLNQIIDNEPDFQPAYVLKSNVLFEKKEVLETRTFLESAYERFPVNQSIGRLFASILVDTKEFDEAEKVFGKLVTDFPQNSAFKLSLALVKLENDKIEESRTMLTELLNAGQQVDDAYFYLGRISDIEKNTDKAVENYLNITGGINRTAARERAVYLLMRDERYDDARVALDILRSTAESQELKDGFWGLEFRLLNSFEQEERALQTLSDALEDNPANEELLYARAMLQERGGDLAMMEKDLRKILELNPDNAIAMNALGYTLADKTDRLEEAQALIAQALQIRPNNPAILDSMGWVLFRAGKTQESLLFLLKAFQAMPDGEIGAHLGEVLIKLNQRTDAYEVWKKSLEVAPGHPVLLETLERLAPDLVPGQEPETVSESEQPVTGENENPATQKDGTEASAPAI